MVKHKNRSRRWIHGLESLEARHMLAAPVAVDDTYNVAEDGALGGVGALVNAHFDPGTPPQIVVPLGSTWQFLDRIQNELGTNLSYPTDGQGRTWNSANFDVASSTVGPWGSGLGLLGAGGVDGATTVTPLLGVGDGPPNQFGQPQNLVTTYLFRTTFILTASQAALTGGTAHILCDDGCIGYINGGEAFRINMDPATYVPAGPLATNTLIPTGNETSFTDVPLNLAGVTLVAGVNTLAIEAHQTTLASSDIGMDVEIGLGSGGGGGAEGFVYADNVIPNTGNGNSSNGAYTAAGGFSGGGLSVTLNYTNFGSSGQISGGWSRNFSLPGPETVTVGARYRMTFGNDYDNGETGQAVLLVDGARYGSGANTSLVSSTGDGNGGAAFDSGWQLASFSIPLSAGNHTVVLAGYVSNDGRDAGEHTEVYFDDFSITGAAGGVSVLANDTDADGNPLTANLVNPPAHGTFNFNADGTFNYAPAPNYNGPDSFTYRADDGTATSNTATVAFNVTPVNDAPVAVANAYLAISGRTLTVNAATGVLINDTDVDGTPLTTVLGTTTANGVLNLSPDGGFTYLPNGGFVGNDSFTYRANDGAVSSGLVTVTIAVAGANVPPTGNDDTYQMAENDTLSIADALKPGPVQVFFTNFTGTTPAELSGITTTEGVQGYDGRGPAGNQFAGNLLRNVSGGNPAQSTVLTLNNLPTHTSFDLDFLLAIIDSWNGNNAGQGNAPDRFNVSVDGTTIFSETFDVTSTLDQSYSAPAGAIIVEGVDLGFTTGGSAADSAYNMTAEPRFRKIPHTAPTLTVQFFASGNGWRGGTNDESWGIDNLGVVLYNDAANVFRLVDTGNSWRYLDDGSDQGTAWFDPNFNDAGWAQGPSELGYGDDADGRPEATVVSYGLDENNKHVTTYFRRRFTATNVAAITALTLELLRDDGAAMYLNGVALPPDNLIPGAAYDQLATISIPNADESRYFSFSINPALLIEGTNTLAVEVHQAARDSSDLSFDARLIATGANSYGVLNNDVDPESAPLTATLVDTAAHGSLTLNSNGTFTYTPNSNYHGTDGFTYFPRDGYDDGNLTTVTITIVPGPNQVPIADNDEYGMDEEGTLAIDASQGLLVNDSDPEMDPFTAVVAAAPANGTLALAADGSFTFTPNANFFGDATFTYSAYDGTGYSSPTTVTIHVAGTNDAPIAADDQYFAEVGATLDVAAAQGVLANDQDLDRTGLTATLISPPMHGTFSLASDGSFTYTPNPGFNAIDTFTYEAHDSSDPSNVVTASIKVNARPVAVGDVYNVDEDQTLDVSVGSGLLINDSDGDNDPIVAVLDATTAHGTLTLLPNGSFTYSPAANYFGPDSFTYHVADADQQSAVVTVTIDVAAVNDLPVALDDVYLTFQNGLLTVGAASGALSNDGDVDGPPLVAELVSGVAHGNLTFNPDGSFTYQPATDYIGPDGFTYRASDGSPNLPVRSVSITVNPSSQLVVINEIMYHPLSNNDAQEYIELHNAGNTPINLSGWKLNKAIEFTFPSMTTLAGDGFLVVAANLTAFSAKYPTVTNVIGGWVGSLRDSGQEIELVNATGERIDRVQYFDEGDWATRRRPPVEDNGYLGWEWYAPHDGLGSSLELIQPKASNNNGQNWNASAVAEGTPGRANTVAAGDIAPLISNVMHSPAVPKAADKVTVTAQLSDELPSGTTASLFYRVSVANPGPFSSTAMFDDGMHGDGQAGDGVFGVILPEQPDQTVVEFYVRATDAGNRSRSWPAPTDAGGTQGANLLYQVDETAYAGTQPIMRFVMTVQESNEFQNINRNSNAQENATFIESDGTGFDVRYSAGVRVRGASSRTRNPPGLRINIPSDRDWRGLTSMNLNTQFTWLQHLGNTLSNLSGIMAADTTPVQVRLNGINRADVPFNQNSPGTLYGSYVFMDVFGSEFLRNHLPNDADGNMYKKVRPDNKLAYRSGNVSTYLDDGWSKDSNAAENDWTDLDNLLRVINQTAAGPNYFNTLNQVVNVDQWVRYFAMMTLMNFSETSISNGADDDYDMYRSGVDNRFTLVPHDFDTIFGQGDQSTVTNTSATLFGAIDASFEGTTIPILVPFFHDPEIVARYYKALKDLLDTTFSAVQFDALLSNLRLTDYIPLTEVEEIQTFMDSRRAYVLSQLPASLTVTHNLTSQSGFLRTTTPNSVTLSGTTDVINARRVTVGGNPTTYDGFTRTWTTAAGTGQTTPILNFGSVWKYLDNGTDQGTAWRDPGFNDSTWLSGPGQFGYGDGDEITTVDCGPAAGNECTPQNNQQTDKYVTTYFRTTFNVADLSQFAGLTFHLRRDDGAIVYLNGNEVMPSNLTSGALYDTLAGNAQDDGNTVVELQRSTQYLQQGTNTLAVEIHQNMQSSTDITFDLELLGVLAAGGSAVPLSPGINRVLVQSWDGNNKELQRQTLDVWYDDLSIVDNLQGTIASNTTWTAAAGPYRVTGPLTVDAAATLTIEPGTTVYFVGATAGLTVNGRLVADGTDARHIRMRPDLGSSTAWAGIRFVNANQDNRMAYVDMEYAGARPDLILAQNSTITLDHILWTGTTQTVLEMANTSFKVTNSQFPAISTGGEVIHAVGIPAAGQAIFEGNNFPAVTGANVIIDVTGGQRPGAILQVLNNTLLGGGDDALVLRGADAHVEGNTFMNFRMNNPASSSANAIAALADNDVPSDVTAARNVFFRDDYAVLLENGSTLTFTNNTVVGSALAAINFDDSDVPGNPGQSAIIDGSIFWNTLSLFDNTYVNDPTYGTTQIVLDRSVVPAVEIGRGVGNTSADPKLVSAAGGATAAAVRDGLKLSLGSIAKAAGRNGLDMGYDVPAGTTIGGVPYGTTASPSATLVVAGPGIVAYKYRLDGDVYGAEIPATTPIGLAGLADGSHVVHVVGKNSAGVWQDAAAETASRTWTVQGSYARLFINEVLAINNSAVLHGSAYPDAIELYNAGATTIDLLDMSISDEPDTPRKFVFPAGTTLAAGQYLVLWGNNDDGTPGVHVGFSLKGDGDEITLYDSVANGGAAVDQVAYGMQLANLSIGRGLDGAWGLTQPTLGAANVAVTTGDPMKLKINEWLAAEGKLFNDDHVELYNPTTLPVALGGLYWTDNPLGDPAQHQITALSYIGAGGYLVFTPDGDTSKGADHLNFQLESFHEMIALSTANLARIGTVVYVPQSNDISQGPAPDGTLLYTSFNPPTFGFPNPTSQPSSTTLVRYTDAWRYNASGSDLGTAWRAASYNDSAWTSGAGPLGFDPQPPPLPLNTVLPSGRTTYYFRRHFTVTDPTNVQLSLTTILDDGAVIYVNGVEALRIGMPDGPIDATTNAGRSVDAAYEGPLTIPADSLVAGDNVIAVELHNILPNNDDAVFALELIAYSSPNVVRLLNQLRITEVMYNPQGTTDYEFVELQNVGASTVNLAGVQFANGIDFVFPDMNLAPGQYVVVVGNPTAFEARYGTGINVAGRFTGNLSNGGENIELALPSPFEGRILDFAFDDDWYPATDGQGPSLVVRDPSATTDTWDLAPSWRISGAALGSPGSADPLDGIPPVVTGVFAGSTKWTGTFITRLDILGLGTGGYSIPIGGGPAVTLPWSNVDQISVEFNEGVAVTSDMLSLAGANVANYAPTSFSYDARRATWTFAQPVAIDKLQLTLPTTVVDFSGNALASPFSLRFDVAAGDANGDGTVNGGDLQGVRSRQFVRAADAGYDPRYDVNGSGTISIGDVVAVRNGLGTSLPAGDPPMSGGSPAAAGALSIEVLATRAAVARPAVGPAPRLADRVLESVLDGGSLVAGVVRSGRTVAMRTAETTAGSTDAAVDAIAAERRDATTNRSGGVTLRARRGRIVEPTHARRALDVALAQWAGVGE